MLQGLSTNSKKSIKNNFEKSILFNDNIQLKFKKTFKNELLNNRYNNILKMYIIVKIININYIVFYIYLEILKENLVIIQKIIVSYLKQIFLHSVFNNYIKCLLINSLIHYH